MGVATSLLLASNSPRRIELLTEGGFRFEAVSPPVTERSGSNFTVRELTALNAIRKGLSVARIHPDKVVLAADTLVSLGSEIIGKPVDWDEAREILRRLSGQTHEVCSAVFVGHLALARSISFHEISRVRFRALSNAAIDDYFAKVNPLDKAGAYGAQGCGAEIIENIDGSYTNVVGLPMEKTIVALAEFGISPKQKEA